MAAGPNDPPKPFAITLRTRRLRSADATLRTWDLRGNVECGLGADLVGDEEEVIGHATAHDTQH